MILKKSAFWIWVSKDSWPVLEFSFNHFKLSKKGFLTQVWNEKESLKEKKSLQVLRIWKFSMSFFFGEVRSNLAAILPIRPVSVFAHISMKSGVYFSFCKSQRSFNACNGQRRAYQLPIVLFKWPLKVKVYSISFNFIMYICFPTLIHCLNYVIINGISYIRKADVNY